VFLEVVTVLMARRGLDVARAVGNTLLAAGDLDFIPCSAIFVGAFETFRAQVRPDLSFADAAIATVARRELAAVATFDRGFRALTDLTILPG
jgi:predicted nucleic acid-binding protein